MGNCCSERKNLYERQNEEHAADKELIFSKDDCFIDRYNSLFNKGASILSKLDVIRKEYSKQAKNLQRIGGIIPEDYDLVIHGIAGFIWGVAARYQLEGNPNGFACEVYEQSPYIKINLGLDHEDSSEFFEFYKHLEKYLAIIHRDRLTFAEESRNYVNFLAETQTEMKDVRQDAAREGLDQVYTTRAITNTGTNLKRFQERKTKVDEVLNELEREHNKYIRHIAVLRNAIKQAPEKAKYAEQHKATTLPQILALFMNDPALKI